MPVPPDHDMLDATLRFAEKDPGLIVKVDLDTKWVPILKDADIQLAIFLSSGALWIAGHFWGVVPVESW